MEEMENIERREPLKRPFFIYFPPAHQSKYRRTPSEEPILVVAEDAMGALDAIRRTHYIRGIKRKHPLALEEVPYEKFVAKAEELLREGRRLPSTVVRFAKLESLVKKLAKDGSFLH